jgi:hypothetical protein
MHLLAPRRGRVCFAVLHFSASPDSILCNDTLTLTCEACVGLRAVSRPAIRSGATTPAGSPRANARHVSNMLVFVSSSRGPHTCACVGKAVAQVYAGHLALHMSCNHIMPCCCALVLNHASQTWACVGDALVKVDAGPLKLRSEEVDKLRSCCVKFVSALSVHRKPSRALAMQW